MIDLRSLKAEFATGSGPNRVYSEIRYQENREFKLSLTNGLLETNLQENLRGVSARSFCRGYWGFSSYANPTKDAAVSALREATRNAMFLAGRSEKSNASIAFTGPVQFEKTYASKKSPVQTMIWLEILKSVDAMIARKYPDLKSRSLLLRSLDMEKQFTTSDGAEVHTMTPHAFLTVSMTKDSKFGPMQFQDTKGGLGQLQDFFLATPEQFEQWIDEVYSMVEQKTASVAPVTGVHDVILDPELAGMVMHESVGHATEADLVMAGSIAWDKMNQIVGSPLVNVVDFANTYNANVCPNPVHVDDEGVAAEDTTIISQGILKSFLHNRESAKHFDQKPAGHARSFLFSDEPLIRMRNTAVLPGKSTIEEMIGSIENGYYLMRAGRGQADTTGEFLFAVGTGFEIKNGQLGSAIRDTAISGIAFDWLGSISMIGNDFRWASTGYMCTKKQRMPVGIGSPSLKCKIRVSGA